MPSDDRERSFEHALASYLRADAKGITQPECFDAETLAAYHQRSLSPEHTASLKTHLLECGRCQGILAQLRATDEIAAPVITEQRQAATSANAANSPIHVLTRRRSIWRWVAPAGAMAAALLVWVSVHQNNSLVIPAKSPSPDAKHAQSTAVQSPPPSPAPASPSDEIAQNKADSLSAKIQGPPLQRSGSLSKQKDLSAAKKETPLQAPLDQLAQRSLGRNAAPAQPSHLKARNELSEIGAARAGADKKIETEEEEKVEDGRRDRILATAPRPSQSAAAAPVPSLEARESAQASAESAGASRATPVSGGVVQQQEMGGRSKFRQAIRLAKSASEITISSPSARASWRIGEAGLIEFSSDAGKTWTVQPSEVVADLRAGSAPSEKICWIVGRSGTILRTIDGGAHWQKLNAPVPDDLQSVVAVDPNQAIVSIPNASYQTKDGGITWSKLAPE